MQRGVAGKRMAGKRAAGKRPWAKRANSSLKLHTDESTGLRGQLIGMAQGKSADGRPAPGLVIVPGTSGAMPKGGFAAISASEQAACEQRALVVEAPAGSIVLWDEAAVHANAGDGHELPTTSTATVTLATALANPASVHALVNTHGYCVVTGILDPTECAAMVRAAQEAVRASCARPGAPFKGAGGNGLWKHYGVSTHELLRPFHVHPNALALWRGLLGTEHICFSPDALAFMTERNADGGHDIGRPTRVTLIQCFGRAHEQLPQTGAKKLEYYRRGGSCNHPPCKLSRGGSGRHYSDRDGDWRAQTPTFGRDEEVDRRFIAALGP